MYAQYVGPPPLPHTEATAASGVVAEKDGLRLHLNPLAQSGYKGVISHHRDSRYQVMTWEEGKPKQIGMADTAVEGAVMYAQYVGPPPLPSAGAPRTLEGDNDHGDEDEQAAAGCSTAATAQWRSNGKKYLSYLS